MSAKVEIVHNPYRKSLQVLINGQPVSGYSRLQQFNGECFVNWCDRILDAVSEECNGDSFALHFTSGQEERRVMEKLAVGCPRCVQYVSHPHQRDMALTERMRQLNTLLKGAGGTGYHVFRKKVLFLLPEGLAHLKNDLQEMEVRNSFCQLDAFVMDHAAYRRCPQAADAVFLLCLPGQAGQAAQRLSVPAGFVLEIGEDTGFDRKADGLFFYGTSEENLFSCIFSCLLLDCLMEVFFQCMASLSGEVKQACAAELQQLTSVESILIPVPDSTTIELGRSVPIHFTTDLETSGVDICKLRFDYSVQGVISCNGMRVEGLKPGRAVLQIYQEGAWEPCASVTFTVQRRNRIQSLTLDAEQIRLGEGDSQTLTVSYLPEDADNTDQIQWSSDAENIATVDQEGRVSGVQAGQCTIRCIAERVCAECVCVVQAHLQRICADVETLDLHYGEQYSFTVQCYPENCCVDGKILCSSMDMQIANVIGRTIKAVGYGQTRVIIANEEETVRTEILVSVLTEREFRQKERQVRRAAGEKKGFLGRLFG